MMLTRRNAVLLCKIVTMAKLIGGSLRGVSIITPRPEHELLRKTASFFMESPLTFTPLLRLKAVANEVIDVNALPRGARKYEMKRVVDHT